MSVRVSSIATLAAGAALLAGCSTIADTVGKSWTTALVGAQEVPGPGDSDATGTAKITADSATGTVCYTLTVDNLPAPTAAHIHSGKRGVAGPVVVPLSPPVDGKSKECLDVEKSVAAGIIADPSAYYVNVHDDAHPKGAIRGQLPAR